MIRSAVVATCVALEAHAVAGVYHGTSDELGVLAGIPGRTCRNALADLRFEGAVSRPVLEVYEINRAHPVWAFVAGMSK